MINTLVFNKRPRFKDIPLMPYASYRVDVPWDMLEAHLEHDFKRKFGAVLDLNLDFQREHVWTQQQQTSYVESMLQGVPGGRELYFNCVGWMSTYVGPYVIVDGKQRLEAVRKFLRNELPIFNGFCYQDFEGKMDMFVAKFSWNVANLPTRSQVLDWYLKLNSSGVVHSPEELAKVRALLEQEMSQHALK